MSAQPRVKDRGDAPVGSDRAPAVVKPTDALRRYTRDLAESYVEPFSTRGVRWFPAAVCCVGVVLAFSLVYVRLSWFFFGPSIAAAALLTLLMGGDDIGHSTVKERFVRWVRVWPIWEYVFWGLALTAFLVASVVYGFWPPILMGGVVGVTIAAIFYLTVLLPLRERREEIAEKYDRLVSELTRHGVSSLALEGGMPTLMGKNWMPLFEKQFGYEAYRSIAQQISTLAPELLENRDRRRDFMCDFFSTNSLKRRGLIGGLVGLRRSYWESVEAGEALKELESGTAEDVSEDRTEMTDGRVWDFQSDEPVQIRRFDTREALQHGVASINIHSLNAENLSIHAADLDELSGLWGDSGTQGFKGEKKQKHDAMMEEARSSGASGQRERNRKWNRFLGDEVRLTLAILLFFVFCFWTFQSHLIHDVCTVLAGFRFSPPAELQASFQELGSAMASSPQALSPLGISGWAIGIASLLLALSSLSEGWRLSLFAIPAAAVVLAGCTATLVYTQPMAVALGGVVIAVGLCATGVWFERHRAG